jgi:hypothetical protein
MDILNTIKPHRKRIHEYIPEDDDVPVLLEPNYTTYFQPMHVSTSQTISNIAIEIKPKWLYIPSRPYIHPIKSRKCRFCMHKYLKYIQSMQSSDSSTVPIKGIQKYCPMKLLSNSKQALHDLFLHPGNNLRLFVDGTNVELDSFNWDILTLFLGSSSSKGNQM